MFNQPTKVNNVQLEYVLETKDGHNCLIPSDPSPIAAIAIGDSYEPRSKSRTAIPERTSQHTNCEPLSTIVEYPLIEIFSKNNCNIFEQCGRIAERDFLDRCHEYGFIVSPVILRTFNTERLETREALRVRAPLSNYREEFFKPEDIEFIANALKELNIISKKDVRMLIGTFSNYLISQCSERILLAYDSNDRIKRVTDSLKARQGKSQISDDQVMHDFKLGSPTQFYREQMSAREPFATFRGEHKNLNGEDLQQAFKTLALYGDLHMLDEAQSRALQVFATPMSSGAIPASIHLSSVGYTARFKRQFGEWMRRFFTED